MHKDFIRWNELKQKLDIKKPMPYFHPRQIWHTHIGKNIGREQNGKEGFLRPVLILKKLSPETFLGIPLTRSKRKGKYCLPLFNDKDTQSYGLLDQIKVFDARRLRKKKQTLPEEYWGQVQQQLHNLFIEEAVLNPCGHDDELAMAQHNDPSKNMSLSQYQSALDSLNTNQRQAVEQIYGPVLVLAGPGTGKTHMLTTRIAHILQKTDAKPQNILCLTFTENAAVEMRNRLQKWIGPESYQVKISTFHGFAQNIMDHYPALFEGHMAGKALADDLQKALVFREVLQSQPWEYFRPSYDEFAEQRNFFSAIDSLKREHITHTQIRESIPTERERLESDPKNLYTRKYGQYEKGDFKPNKKAEIERKISKLTEFCTLWEGYEDALHKNKYYDFNDLINWTVEMLKTNEELRFDLQEQYQWILVDEYQDTNTAQNEILWALCDNVEEPNLFVVGDDDQSIYRFQGASIANIQDFRKRFAKRLEITLDKNYRSYQPILDAAYGVVTNNQERANKDTQLEAQRQQKETSSSPVSICELIAPYSEISFIVQTIRKKIDKGYKHKDIAILVRTNKEIEALARELPKFDIPVSANVAQNIFENRAVVWLLQMLQVLHNPSDDETLFTLLHAPFWNIAPHDLLTLSLERRQKKTNLIQHLINHVPDKGISPDPETQSLFDQAPTGKPTTSLPPKLLEWIAFFGDVRTSYHHMRPGALAEKVLYESGLGNWLTTHKYINDWQCIRKTIEWIREQEKSTQGTLPDILDKTQLHQDLGIALRPDPLPRDQQSVQIMTTHKAKGLEFGIVIIPGLHDKKWGNTRKRGGLHLPPLESLKKTSNDNQKRSLSTQDGLLDSKASDSRHQEDFVEKCTSSVHVREILPDNAEARSFSAQQEENEEERRLFFVALTRAKNEIYCCYANTDFTGREKVPSQFLHEIPASIPHLIDTDETEEQLANLLPIFFQQQEHTLTQAEQTALAQRAQNFVWSASSLQNYLDCPRRFLYQNLYRFPRKPLPHLAQGVALHESLERLLRLQPSAQTEEALLKEYHHALEGQNVSHTIKDQLAFEGEKILKHYFANRLQKTSEDNPYGYELEYNFGKLSPQIEGIRITGKMDKVVYLDEKKSVVKIIDYKSGKPKPIKDGERLWRQLVFYDILARNALKDRWKIESCELEFLTPDPKNNQLATKSLVVTEEDRQKVILELKQAHQKIQNLEFPVIDNPKSDPDIEYWNNFGM